MAWKEFAELADDEYDSSYGSPEVATDLIIRFSDGKHMWREEYDGSEWWGYVSPIDVDYTAPGKPIARLIGKYWATLRDLHSEDPRDIKHHQTRPN